MRADRRMRSRYQSMMSRFLNVLRSWLVMVSIIAMGNTLQSFRDHSFLSEKLYTGTPSLVNGLQARTFGIWTLLSSVIRCCCAIDIHNKTWTVLSSQKSQGAGHHPGRWPPGAASHSHTPRNKGSASPTSFSAQYSSVPQTDCFLFPMHWAILPLPTDSTTSPILPVYPPLLSTPRSTQIFLFFKVPLSCKKL
ncbi:ergosterol biosynthetic protein 28 homolog isoform X2 [Dermochelys coriacea]|uniref:ergosterol biosynthetic protein 28 homolog isoform X2 n=1 Tax=Dermochelys coriacea TaxID=27794 RepID=UPI0018E73EFA|nr:ergosterol biosynthetic protein 28 homolog isoform X2 [Dermochelys coriacea]